MGSTYSTIQIKKPCPDEQFKSLLCDYYRKKGLVPVTEEDAEFSFWLAFTEDGDWVTMGAAGYDLWDAHVDLPEIARELNTYCIITYIWDSDSIVLELFGAAKSQSDETIIEYPVSDFTIPAKKRKLWEPIFEEGTTWEQFLEKLEGDHIFAEGALYEIAPLFGIAPEKVTYEYCCSEDISSSDSNVTIMHFKEAESPSGNIVDLNQYRAGGQPPLVKKRSLNKVFNDVFGEGLGPLGFVKIKGPQPYFVRLVGDEIIHIVMYIPRLGTHFEIRGGVATVYRSQLSLDERPFNNINWSRSLVTFYEDSNPFGENLKYSVHDLQEFFYEEETICNGREQVAQTSNHRRTITDAVEQSLRLTTEIMVPEFNKLTDIDSCMDYFIKNSLFIDGLFAKLYENFENAINYNEDLLLVKSGNRDFYIASRESARATRLARITHSINSGRVKYDKSYIENHKNECKAFVEGKAQRIIRYNKFLDGIFCDSALYAKALAELELRKAKNTGLLRSYGFDL